MRTLTLRRTPAVVALAGALLAGACGGEPAPTTVDRDAFVAAYVDLRMAAIETGGTAGAVRKQAILAQHGVTEEEMVEFARVHGRDAAFMREVWNEVQEKLDSARLSMRGVVPSEESGGGTREGDEGEADRSGGEDEGR